jgi:hypothetical protein
MLRTTHILIPTVAISLTILGLAVILQGGFLEIQIGPDNRIHIEKLQKPPDSSGSSKNDSAD